MRLPAAHLPMPRLSVPDVRLPDTAVRAVRSVADAVTTAVGALPAPRRAAQRAIATTVAATGGWLAARMTGTPGRAGTVALASLVNAQLAQTAVASHGDPIVLASAGVSALALFGIVQTPGVSGFFGCRPLGPLAWTIVTAATVTGAVIGAIPGAGRRAPAGAVHAGMAALATVDSSVGSSR